jgi:hypothetical protein
VVAEIAGRCPRSAECLEGIDGAKVAVGGGDYGGGDPGRVGAADQVDHLDSLAEPGDLLGGEVGQDVMRNNN